MMDPKKESLRKIPTVHAPTAGGDIGGPLKSARQKKGWSLDNVAQQTRIPKKYLEAMENNRTDELPALVYLRGFLKGYCDYLEIEFEPLWKQVTEPAPMTANASPEARQDGGASAPPPTPTPKEEPKPAEPAAPVSEVKEAPKPKSYAKPVVRPAPKSPVKPTDDEPSVKYAPAAPRAPSSKPAAAKAQSPHEHHAEAAEHGAPPRRDLSGAIALAVSIAVALGVFIWLKKQDSRPPETQPQAPVALAPVATRGVELGITFKDETWISLRGDGSLLFEGLAPKGAQQKWKAQRGFLLRSPHAQDLTLTLNGAPYTLAEVGADGEFKIE